MYDFFKNIAEKNSCALMGACSVHPSVNALYQVILNEIREISSYLVKLKEFKIEDIEAMDISIDGLSIFLINTSYNQKNYLNFIQKLNETKNRVKKTYSEHCKSNNLPSELINSNFNFDKNMTISELINYSQNSLTNYQKNTDKKKERLFELITLFSRLCAIELTKIGKFKDNCNELKYEVLRFFALTSSYSIRNEKIKRRIYEFSDFSLKIAIELASIYQKRYGLKENAETKSELIDGHCILVSGDDLNELEKVLKTLENLNLKQEINVYTHGPLFLAHFYPYFKKNKFLKGHFGSDNAEYDFSVFGGSILITQNFIQKIDSLYRGEIFSNKLISFEKVFDIKNDDYTPLIEAALKLDKCQKSKESKTINIEYDREKIKKFINETSSKEVIAISGIVENKENIIDLNERKIVELNCPLEGDILLESIETLKEKNIKITAFFSQCNLSNLAILFMILNRKVDIHIANCPHVLINPHVIECL